MQKEQRHSLCDQLSNAKSESAALVAIRTPSSCTPSNRTYSLVPREPDLRLLCIHSGKHEYSNKGHIKFPHLYTRPPRLPIKKDQALIGRSIQTKNVSDYDNVCLLGVDRFLPRDVSLNANTKNVLAYFGKTIIDSGCTKQFPHDRSAFHSFEKTNPTILDLCASSTAQNIGKDSVSLNLLVKGNPVKCTINNVNHVPDLSTSCFPFPQWLYSVFKQHSTKMMPL